MKEEELPNVKETCKRFGCRAKVILWINKKGKIMDNWGSTEYRSVKDMKALLEYVEKEYEKAKKKEG